MFDFFPLLVAIVALIVARKAFNQIAVLRARLDAFESAPVRPRAAFAPPPLARHQRADQDLATSSPEAAAAQPPPLVGAESISPTADSPNSAPADDAGTAAPAPPPLSQPAATPSFEERVGTRWVVWVGGLTLALGGFFMVRYSIEAGLVGPGVRTLLGGAFALALLAAGEWTPPQGKRLEHRSAADRQHSSDPHRCRHGSRVRHRVCGVCVV